jgi:hypothetical protein
MSRRMFNAAVGISREQVAIEMQRPIDVGIIWASERIAALEEAQRWIPFTEQLPPAGQAMWVHDGVVVWDATGTCAIGSDWKAWRPKEVKPCLPPQETEHEKSTEL